MARKCSSTSAAVSLRCLWRAALLHRTDGTSLAGSEIAENTTRENNRILFTGREWVPGYNFYEFRARAYNPALGRFMSEDPIGFAAGDTNLFGYCGGDPVNKTDPFGLDADPDSGIRQQTEHKETPTPWRVSPGIQGISILGGVTGLDGLPSGGGGQGGGGGWNGGAHGTTTVTGGVDGITVTLQPAPPFFPSGELGFRPGEITFTGSIAYSAGALILSYGRFVGTVTSDTTPPQTYGITGRLDGVGIQAGYITGEAQVKFVGNSPTDVLGRNGGFWTLSAGLGAGPIDIFGVNATASAYPTPNGPASASFGSANFDYTIPGLSTAKSDTGFDLKPGVGFSGAFFGITVQTITPLPGR
jgi:RHS repeat-associated protein